MSQPLEADRTVETVDHHRGLESENEFVVKFANVNGSGSASTNRLFTRAVLRLGVPATPRNVFPSNIEGLPTWYEVRISEANRLARHGEVHLLVAMNPQTWDRDVRELAQGGYLLYDSTRPMPESRFRPDIVRLGVPFTAICNREYSEPRQRQLFKNVMYVGALAALLEMDVGAIEQLLGEQFRGRDQLIEANRRALHLGVAAARERHACPIGLRVRRADVVGDRIFIDGNNAAALGAVYGGATVAAWYPITPSTSLAEAFQRYCRKYRTEPKTGRARYAIVQAEDELASIGMVVGAAWNGARAFTATSGPGISLMQETIGLAYFAEIPAVIFDVQRAGPSTGMPTRTQQGDLLSCAYASHGDTRHVLLFPEDPHECFEFAAAAFDLADRLQTPVFVMLDLEIGMNERLTAPFVWDDSRRMDRGKVMTAEDLEQAADFGRYMDPDGDGIPIRTYPGTHPSLGSFFTRGTTKDGHARYTEDGATYVENVQRLLRKHRTARLLVPPPIVKPAPRPTLYGVIYFGSSSPAMNEAADVLAADGIALDLMRIRAFPFPPEVMDFIATHTMVFVVEQNRDAQLRSLLINEGEIDPAHLCRVLSYDGTPITSRFIARTIGEQVAARESASLRPGSRPKAPA
ncbi:MAG: 2-oxoacid:acceptor oxidoreductase subunit alpha [Acetobacteraceae bacterium]